jgi:hypothetical protein
MPTRGALHVVVTFAAMVGLVFTVGATSATATTQPRVTTVASGFDNPRGVVVGRDGRLFVAEAGRGGPKCVTGGPEGNLCVGLTGAISVINPGGGHSRILSGLASISDEGGVAATGPDGLSRNSDGSLFTVMTSCRQQVAELPTSVFGASLVNTVKSQVGQIIKQVPGGYERKADVGGFGWDWSLDHKGLVPGQFPDCNPYGILTQDDGVHWVVDAATNTLDRISPDGRVQIVSFFPNPSSSDAVPTCVSRGPDGALYIGELTGGGNGPGASRIWRVDPRPGHRTPTLWASGLTAVTGCGWLNGSFYATEFSTLGFESFAPGTGAVVRVPAHSTSPVTVVDGLSFPQSFAGSGHSIYVSNWSVAPAQVPPGSGFQPGSVVRIDL